MFDFQNLQVYTKAQEQHSRAVSLISSCLTHHRFLQDQLYRASLSIILNIAEGTGKFSRAGRRNFYTIARGSTYECVAIVETLITEGIVSETEVKEMLNSYEVMSKMLLGLINSQR